MTNVVSYTKAKIDALIASAVQRANHTGTQDVSTITGLAQVASTGSYTDLSSRPILGTAAAQAASAFDAAGAAAAAQAAAVQRANHTGTQPATTVTGLAAVATSGAYSDLLARPTLGTAAAQASTAFDAAGAAATAQTAATSAAKTAADGTYVTVVAHGGTASMARPAGAVRVFWLGTVAPTNAVQYDRWVNPSNSPYVESIYNGTAWGSFGVAASSVSGLGSAATQPSTAFDASGAAAAAQTAATAAAKTAADGTYITVVAHGSTAATARPAGAVRVYWLGSVAPTNAQQYDRWVNNTTSPYVEKIYNGSAFVSFSIPALSVTGLSTVDPRQFATLALDAGLVVNVTATSGSAVVTSATAAWKVGQTVAVRKAGASGGTLVGTVQSISGTSATLSVAAGTSGTNLQAFYGTDDTAAWQAALNACRVGDTLDLSGSWVSLITNLTVPAGVRLLRDGRGPFDPQSNPVGTPVGPTFALVGNNTAAITVNGPGGGVGDVICYYINQVSYDQATPSNFGPAFFTPTNSAGIRFGHLYVANAWKGAQLRGGRHVVASLSAGAANAALEIDFSYDFIDVGFVRHEPFWNVCEGVSAAAAAGSLTAYAMANANSVSILRSDSFHIGRIETFYAQASLACADSGTAQAGGTCGYGQVDCIDADTVAYAIIAVATNSPGVQVGSLIYGGNGTGIGTAGQVPVVTFTGGSLAPQIKVSSISSRGTGATTNASSNKSVAAGTVVIPAGAFG